MKNGRIGNGSAAAFCVALMMLAAAPLSADWVSSVSAGYPSGTIITVAGGGTDTLKEGGTFTTTSAILVYYMRFDEGGSLYLADFGNNMIRKVDPSGIIRTIAGIGTMGFSGDGGPATSAQLDCPYSIAFDSAGSMYIAEYAGFRIRKVDAKGIITTVAGNGVRGYSGDGGPAAKASIDKPSGIAVDSRDNLYIADWGNNRVRKVDTAGTISTFAGTGKFDFSGDGGPAASATLRYPSSLAFDATGSLYVTDNGNHRIRKVDQSGTISSVAGKGTPGYSGDGGPALEAEIFSPWNPVFDASGNMYFTDVDRNTVRKVDASGIISTVAGCGINGYTGDGGPAALARVSQPLCVAVDSLGNIYVATYRIPRIRMVIH